MTAFIDEFREEFGVEPICRVLPIAPSTYHARKAVARDPSCASARMRRDAELKDKIQEVWSENRKLYGTRKVWHALKRDGVGVARCTVERLMREMGLQGVVRGKKIVTTNPDTARPCPDDKVNRAFHADRPNQLWGCPLWRHRFEPDGRRLYLCADLVGHRLRRFRNRRFRAPDCGLACIQLDDNPVRT